MLRSVYNFFSKGSSRVSKFKHKIVKNVVLKPPEKNHICIFSHYDKSGIIDEYVMTYLVELSRFSDIVFVTTSENIHNEELEKLNGVCNQIIVKENYGYDFGAWKTGMEFSNVHFHNYDCLILCNDSVYGPFYNIKEIIDEAMSKHDVFSITDSFEKDHHLQSYFIVYSHKAFTHKYFINFWKDFVGYKNKFKLIKESEVKFTNKLFNSNLSVSSHCKADELTDLERNPSHFYWDRLIVEKNCPFIKIELLRDNPFNVSLKGWKSIVQATGYDLELIEGHLKRVRST